MLHTTSKQKSDNALDKTAKQQDAGRRPEQQVGQTISRQQLKQVGGGNSLPVGRW